MPTKVADKNVGAAKPRTRVRTKPVMAEVKESIDTEVIDAEEITVVGRRKIKNVVKKIRPVKAVKVVGKTTGRVAVIGGATIGGAVIGLYLGPVLGAMHGYNVANEMFERRDEKKRNQSKNKS